MAIATAHGEKLDLYKQRPEFFTARKQPMLVDLPEAAFLVVDGTGTPDGPMFQNAIGALYYAAYTMKFAGKKLGHDFKVPTFEGAWWVFSDAGEYLPREQWRWQLHMMVPDYITQADLEATLAELARKGKSPAVPVRLERIRQGLCVQVMHVGSYAAETETIERMLAFMKEQGLRPRGPHHEVYIGDPRRTAPERLKTLLKWPVERAKCGALREAALSVEKLLAPMP